MGRIGLRGIEIPEAKSFARHDAHGEIRPPDRRIVDEGTIERRVLRGRECFFERLDCGDDRFYVTAAARRLPAGRVERVRAATCKYQPGQKNRRSRAQPHPWSPVVFRKVTL